METKSLSAKLVRDDILSGLSPDQVKQKYALTNKQFESVTRKLVSMGILSFSQYSAWENDEKIVANKPVRRLLAGEIVEAIRSGLSNEDMMRDYNLSERSFQRLLEKLLNQGFITELEFELRKSEPNEKPTRGWTCPHCNMVHTAEVSWCARCGLSPDGKRQLKVKPKKAKDDIVQPATKELTDGDWKRIVDFASLRAEEFGLPRRRGNSVVLGSFNICKLGKVDSRAEGAWELLSLICERFDLMSIQEIQGSLEGIRHLKRRLNNDYRLIISDVTGNYPGDPGLAERLGFLYKKPAVRRTEVTSDITYDNSKIIEQLYFHRYDIWKFFKYHTDKKRPPKSLPCFLTFIRQPFCVSFEIGDSSTTKPYQFLAVNCHLLYGKTNDDRWEEFEALFNWLIDRIGGRSREKMYYPNIILMGDCNLQCRAPRHEERVSNFLQVRNQEFDQKGGGLHVNFPFLEKHPVYKKVFRTAARTENTFDQIAFISTDTRFPNPEDNSKAQKSLDGYDYGTFNFMDLISKALLDKPFEQLNDSAQRDLYEKVKYQISDHLPIWIRLPMPS